MQLSHTNYMTSLVSIIIPTNKPFAIWKPLLHCIAQQTYPSLEVILCIDRVITSREFDTMSSQIHEILDPSWVIVSLITIYNTTFVAGKWASYVRNYGAQVAQGAYIQYMDDDGIFEPDYIHSMLTRYELVSTALAKDCITSPTIMYRDTGQIQSQGFDRVWRGLCRPQPHHATDWKSKLVDHLWFHNIKTLSPHPDSFAVSCIGAMGLFAPRELFQVIRFDEEFEFVYEDLDMTLRATRAWVPCIVHDDICIEHMEADKSLAQRSYAWSARMTYYKARNRILFVQNNAPRRGKLIFYLWWLWLHTLWLAVMIIIVWSDRLGSCWSLVRGTRDGLTHRRD